MTHSTLENPITIRLIKKLIGKRNLLIWQQVNVLMYFKIR